MRPDDEDLRTCGSFQNEQRKRQWFGCRAALNHLLQRDNVKVVYDGSGKPHLGNGSPKISLSHTGDFSAAIISWSGAAGIDIELIKPRIIKVRDRFLSAEELQFLSNPESPEELCYYWCSKEALYKICEVPVPDFRNDIRIMPIDYLCNTNHSGKGIVNHHDKQEEFSLFYEKRGELMVVAGYKEIAR